VWIALETCLFTDTVKCLHCRNIFSSRLNYAKLSFRCAVSPSEIWWLMFLQHSVECDIHVSVHCCVQTDSMVIPSAAIVYAQVVTSQFLRHCNMFEPIHLSNGECIVPPAEVARCSGAAAVHDLQLSQVTQDSFTPLTPPIPVFR